MNPFDLAKQMPQIAAMGEKLIQEMPEMMRQWKEFQQEQLRLLREIHASCERTELMVTDILAEVSNTYVMSDAEKAEVASWPVQPTAQPVSQEEHNAALNREMERQRNLPIPSSYAPLTRAEFEASHTYNPYTSQWEPKQPGPDTEGKRLF